MRITTEGQQEINDAVYGTFNSVHLFMSDGQELTGHGYAPYTLDPGTWSNGLYRDIHWEFEAGETVFVAGYYVTGRSGTVIFLEELPEPVEVTHKGTKIAFTLSWLFGGVSAEMTLQ